MLFFMRLQYINCDFSETNLPGIMKERIRWEKRGHQLKKIIFISLGILKRKKHGIRKAYFFNNTVNVNWDKKVCVDSRGRFSLAQ